MSHIRKPRIALVAGKYLRENPYRELALKEAFESRGAEVILILPGPRLTTFSYDQAAAGIFKRTDVVWINRFWQYLNTLRRVDGVVIGSWKSKHLVRGAMALGRLVVEHDSSGGMDYYSFGSDALLTKGAFPQRACEAMWRPKYPAMDIHMTGSILYERPRNHPPLLSRDAFLRQYGLDPERPLAVFFPKAIQLFHDKLRMWFPERGDEYHAWYMERRAAICVAARDAGFNLMLKLHPAAYASYRTHQNAERTFWGDFPWARIVEPQHTFEALVHMEVGIGIVSHSALDAGYWRRPFIYVDSDIAPVPEIVAQGINLGQVALPPGPSLEWEVPLPAKRTYPFPSWVGIACCAEDLTDVLRGGRYIDPLEEHYDRFIEEFWFQADGHSADRIADYVLSRLETFQPRPPRYWSLAAMVRDRLMSS